MELLGLVQVRALALKGVIEMSDRPRILLPKLGKSLDSITKSVFGGLGITPNGRGYLVEADDARFVLGRPSDTVSMIRGDRIDGGVYPGEYEEIIPNLSFGVARLNSPVGRIVLACGDYVADNPDRYRPRPDRGFVTVGCPEKYYDSEYGVLAARWIDESEFFGDDCRYTILEPYDGSIEVLPKLTRYCPNPINFIVDYSDTGETLRANDCEVLETLKVVRPLFVYDPARVSTSFVRDLFGNLLGSGKNE